MAPRKAAILFQIRYSEIHVDVGNPSPKRRKNQNFKFQVTISPVSDPIFILAAEGKSLREFRFEDNPYSSRKISPYIKPAIMS